MDQRQRFDIHGYGCSGPGTQRHKGGDLISEYRPYYRPESRDTFERNSMEYSLAHIQNGFRTGRRSLGGDMPNLPGGLGASQHHNLYSATNPDTFDRGYAYSCNTLPQGVANGYGPAGWTFQQRFQRRSQECGITDIIQPGSEPTWHPRERYSDPIPPYGLNTDLRPVQSIEQTSPSFSCASNIPYPVSTSICAKCGNHPHIGVDSVYQYDQRDIRTNTDLRLQGAKNYFLRPVEQDVLANRQLPTQETKRITCHNERSNVSSPEHTKSGFSLRMSAAVNSAGNPVTTQAEESCTNKGLTKKRKRKARISKPRKPRTLTDEGKAHAKAIRDYPGGACEDCKRKKTKARDPEMTNLVSRL